MGTEGSAFLLLGSGSVPNCTQAALKQMGNKLRQYEIENFNACQESVQFGILKLCNFVQSSATRQGKGESLNNTQWSASIFKVVLCAMVLLAAGGAAFAAPMPMPQPGHLPVNIFAPAATPARQVYSVALFIFGVTGVIFVVVTGALFYAVIRYRQRPGDEQTEPPQVYGSRQIEMAWTVVPVLIVVVLFLVSARVIYGVQNASAPSRAVQVTAIGHQFWWEFRYPQLGIVTANELHVPVSPVWRPTPTYLTLTSADVVHSFWVPRLAGKTDMIPNHVNTMWIDPSRPGIYLGQCGQYCGTEHAKMLLRVYVDTPEQFAAWVRQQQQAASDVEENPEAAAGKRVFAENSCVNCHRIAGTRAQGLDGPDLTHLMSRATIAAGAADNTPANLRQWVKDPNSIKMGALMPAMDLTDQQLDQITAYLTTLH
jgi:cytochrome c oxidase subunit 2